MALEFYTTNNLPLPLAREITDFLDSQNTSHLFQFPQWNFSGERFALMRESGSIRWFGTFGMYCPLGAAFPWMHAVVAYRGPVCDDGKLWHAMTLEVAEQFSRERITYFDVVPDWVETPAIEQDLLHHAGWEALGGERTCSLRLDVDKSEDEIFAGFRKNSRYEIRRAERLGVSVTPASNEAEMEEFLRLYERLADRKGFEAQSADHLRGRIRWLTGEGSRGALLLARFENVVYGGAVIGRAGRRCWYVWGASDKHEAFNVGHILQWNALLWAKSHGCVEYDFGGYTPGATSGPAWFKSGFGGKVVRFIPLHRKVIRPGSYRIFNFLSQMKKLTRCLPSAARMARTATANRQ
jgi:hypothetical protein